MQATMSSMQWEMRSMNKRVEQNQLDLQGVLCKYHHPDSSDDEGTAAKTLRRPRS